MTSQSAHPHLLLVACLVWSIASRSSVWHLFLREAWRGSLWFRNHRKILIVDGRVGFCGGMNVSGDYYGRQEPPSDEELAARAARGGADADDDGEEYVGGTGKFRDTHLQLEGPAVAHLERVSRDTFQEAAHVLEEDWAAASAHNAAEAEKHTQHRAHDHEQGSKTKWYPSRGAEFKLHDAHTPGAHHLDAAEAAAISSSSIVEAAASSSAAAPSIASIAALASAAASGSLVCDSPDLFVQVLPSNVFRNLRLIQRAMLLTVRNAKHRVLITNPYFFPPPALFRALQQAADRGVEVVVMCPGEGRTDVPVTRWASQHIYYTLLKSGVKIFEMQSATLHAKTVTIDGIYTSIGSFNWDRSESERAQQRKTAAARGG